MTPLGAGLAASAERHRIQAIYVFGSRASEMAARVDLVVLPDAAPFLALDIIEGECLHDSDPDETARYELYVMRRAGDLWPLERERREMILKEGAR